MHALTGPVDWPAGPPTEQVAELVRTLELTINRRLDGALHGNHQGITPGHGSEPGESRRTSRATTCAASTGTSRRARWRPTSASRSPTATSRRGSIVDTSAAMRFGTTVADKSQAALVAAASVGFLTARNQNRLGAVLVAGPHLKVMPPRHGRDQVRAVLAERVDAAAVGGPRAGRPRRRARPGGRDQQAPRVRRRRLRLRRRRVDRPARPPRDAPRPARHHGPRPPRARRAAGRDDRRRRPVDGPPPRGPGHRRRAAPLRRGRRRGASRTAASRIRRAGADLIELATDGDWLAEIVGHVTAPAHAGRQRPGARRRHRDRCSRATFLAPRPPVVAARRRRPRRRLRRHPAVGAAGDRALHPGRPARPRRPVAARVGAATSSPRSCCSASPPASWPSPGPCRRRPSGPRARGASCCCSTCRCR